MAFARIALLFAFSFLYILHIIGWQFRIKARFTGRSFLLNLKNSSSRPSVRCRCCYVILWCLGKVPLGFKDSVPLITSCSVSPQNNGDKTPSYRLILRLWYLKRLTHRKLWSDPIWDGFFRFWSLLGIQLITSGLTLSFMKPVWRKDSPYYQRLLRSPEI